MPSVTTRTKSSIQTGKVSELAYIALNRFLYGADKKSRNHINSLTNFDELKNWLKSQITPYKPKQIAWTSELAITGYYHHKQAEKQEKQMMENSMMAENPSMGNVKVDRKKLVRRARTLAEQTALASIESELPMQSHLLDFFSNHFSVTRANLPMTLLAPTLETEAIAPNLDASFADMLIAVTQHPAMLLYLNNEKSTGPASPIGARQRKKNRKNPRGLNENLAREILELHTLGVNAGYTQNDVIELAKAITGWSIGAVKRNENPGFVFRQGTHEKGARELLGKKYSPSGVTQGENILRDLAMHPATAHHVSFKLAKHFVADQPTQALVKAMTSAWMSTNGNIAKVVGALIDHKDSWQAQAQKLKKPREFVVSACRVCNVRKPTPGLFQTLEILGHGLFNAGSPAGFPDEESAWLGASALNTRIEWANHFASAISKRLKGKEPSDIATQALGPLLSQNTLQHISRAGSKQQALALFLMSPEFQRR